MSIIERAAELLRSTPLAQSEPSPPAKGSGHLEQSPIARAVEDIGRRRVVPEAKPAPGRGPARAVRVDRDRLRRQSMILPDGERSAITETFRRIKRTLLTSASSSAAGAPPANLVMVTSASPGEGKTFC